ncbi:MAG: DoxX family protein [Bacteroidetes bacterium]|nr:DoxX family protein [Bacteroidota bacterium]
MRRSPDFGLLILRLSVGVLMLLHGIAKLKGVTGIEGMLQDKGLPGFLAYGVYIGEIAAPIFLIVGYRTRVAALVFAINCVVAALLAHADDITQLSKSGGWAVELLGLYFFGAIALFFTGGGKLAFSSSNKWD